MESLTLNRTEVEPESESHYPPDLLELRHGSTSSLHLLQAMSNAKGGTTGEKSASTRQSKIIGVPPSNKSRKDRDQKRSTKKPKSKSRIQRELPTYGRGSDPSPKVQDTFMDQVKPPIVNSEQVERRKKLRKYVEKKQKRPHFTDQQPTMPRKIYAELAHLYPGKITWESLWKYCESNQEAAQSLNVAEVIIEGVNGLCDKVGCRPDDTVTVQDLEDLFYAPKNTKSVTVREVKKKQIKQKPDHIVLADDVLDAIFDTFYGLDIHKEQIIIREDFITAIGELEIANSNLETIAFVLPEEKKLGEVLATIEDDGNDVEDLTLAQLYNYFQYNYVPSDEQGEDSNAVILEKQDLRVLYNTYSKFVGEGDATNTEQFVNAILEGANFGELRKKTARKQSRKSKHRDETVEILLRRIKESEGETLTWNIFLAYLTPHGEPQNVEELVEVEESEPAALEYVSSDSSILNQTTDEDINKPPLTVPNPPSFLFRKNFYRGGITERKGKEMIAEKEQEELKELNNKFRSRDVDKDILEPKYNQMEAEQQRLREENRERRKQELLTGMHPFAVAEKVAHREMPSKQPPTQFVASEVPETSRQLKWEEMQEEEERRKEKIAQEAEELLKQAALPPRMEADFNKPKKSQVTVQSKHMFRARSAPDFTALHSKYSKTQSRPKKATKCEPFALSETKNCHQPTEDVKPAKSMKEFKTGLETGIKQQKIKQTVLNQMKSQSADQSRRQTFQTEIEEVFTGEMDLRKISFINEIEDVLS